MRIRSERSFFRCACQAAAAVGVTLGAVDAATAAPDYMSAPFETRRVLNWGSRPDWSPDGKRLAFTETDTRGSFAYELDLEDNSVRCLTCQFGIAGHVSRVYYLPDSSFLLVAPAGNGNGNPNAPMPASPMGNVLHWLSADLQGPMQQLTDGSLGEVGISRNPGADGATRIAWGELANGAAYLKSATLTHSGGNARLVDEELHFDSTQKPAGSLVTFTEAYGFIQNDQAITFYTTIETDGIMNGEMYMVNVETGAISALYEDPSHNETHLFPGDEFGLEESNRVSDPDGKWRGVSSHPGWSFRVIMGDLLPAGFPQGDVRNNYAPHGDLRGFNRPFDLFVVDIDNPTRVRQLTDVGNAGANAHQSVTAPDGRRIAFAIDPRSSQTYANRGGLYIGEFEQADAGAQ